MAAKARGAPFLTFEGYRPAEMFGLGVSYVVQSFAIVRLDAERAT